MNLENGFTVDAPLEQTWHTLLDVARVAGCLPGATIDAPGEDGAYRGTLKLKVGPVTMAYAGTVRLHDVDDTTHTLSYAASARERRGTGTAAASIRTALTSVDGDAATEVTVLTELDVTGRAAQFGRGLMEDVAGSMLRRFADGLQDLIAHGGPETPAPGDGVVPGFATASAPSSADPTRVRPAAARDDDVLDMGATIWSVMPRRSAAAAAAAALVASVALLGRRRRRGHELSVTLRWR